MAARDSVVDDPVLDRVIDRIRSVAEPEQIVLFGSRARGTVRPESDYDLLVIARVPHRRRAAQAIYEALYGIEAPVDVVVVTPEDVIRLKDRVGSIIGPAVREGRVVYAA